MEGRIYICLWIYRYIDIQIYTWCVGGVLEWGGVPTHPKLNHFSIETHDFRASPCEETSMFIFIYVHVLLCVCLSVCLFIWLVINWLLLSTSRYT
jgi:hypothetical protein